MNDKQELLDKFGKLIITGFKDEPIDWFNRCCDGNIASNPDKIRSIELTQFSSDQICFIKKCIIKCLTMGIYNFLYKLTLLHDNEDSVHLIINGEDLFDISDELNAELFTENGWDSKFSKYVTYDTLEEDYDRIYKDQYSSNPE